MEKNILEYILYKLRFVIYFFFINCSVFYNVNYVVNFLRCLFFELLRELYFYI